MKKNVAGQFLNVQMTTASDGSNFAGTVTCKVSKDGGALSAIAGTVALTETGNYKVTLDQADTNANHLAFVFVGTGALTVTLQVYTDFPQTGDTYPDRALDSTVAKQVTMQNLFANDGTFYWVDIDRPDDSGDGLTLATAKKTFSAVLSLVVFGDTVKLVARQEAYPYNITIPQGVTVEGFATIDGWSTTKPIINGAYTDIYDPVVLMRPSSVLRNVYIKKWFTQRISSMIVMSENCTIEQCQSYGSAIGGDLGADMFIDMQGITAGRIIDNELVGGSYYIDNAIGSTSPAYKVVIEGNRFDLFIKDTLDLTLAGQIIVKDNIFTATASGYAGIKYRLNSAMVLIDNRYIDGQTLLDETATSAGFGTNLTQNNGSYSSDSPEMQSDILFIKSVVSEGIINGIVKFVNKAGNDSNTGNDWTNAKLTIGSALGSIPSNTPAIVYVASGEYREDILVGSMIKIIGVGSDANIPVLYGDIASTISTLSLSASSSIENFVIGKHSKGSTFCTVIEITGDNCKVKNCDIKDISVALTQLVYVDGDNIAIEDNIFNTENCVSAIQGETSFSSICKNRFSGMTGDTIMLTGELNTISENSFINIAGDYYAVRANSIITTLSKSSIINNVFSRIMTAFYPILFENTDECVECIVQNNVSKEFISNNVGAIKVVVDATIVKVDLIALSTDLDIYAIGYDFTTYNHPIMTFHNEDRPFTVDPIAWCHIYTASGGIPNTTSDIAMRNRVKYWSQEQPQ